jgi:hypothetical protein
LLKSWEETHVEGVQTGFAAVLWGLADGRRGGWPVGLEEKVALVEVV